MRKVFLLKYPAIIMAVAVVWPLAAFATTIDADITLTLPSDGSTYTLKSGSVFNDLDVSGDTMRFSGDTGGSVSVDLRSGDKKTMTNNRNIATVCGTSESSLVISTGPGVTTVTPSGTCGGSSGGGGTSGGGSSSGGGGGGSGSFAPATPTTATVDKVTLLKQQIASVQAAIQQKLALAGSAVKSSGASLVSLFVRNLGTGDRNDSVKTLQQLLARDKDIYPEGLASGLFGPATTRAVQKFQMKYGLIKSVKDPGSGQVGPKTRAKLNELFGAVSAPVVPQITAPPVSTPAVPVPQTPVVSGAPASVQSIRDAIQALQAKLITAQIKAIQDKINALKK
ncbi:MAG: peptidoglycan-binding domain-containing protein [Candidatus Sungiibacteriota bacterium]